MSRKRRTRGHAAAYPALTQFARAYLHEDFLHEYGGPLEAARAFRADANPAECRALADELTQLVSASSGWSPAKLAAFMTGPIGGAWATASPSVLREMAAILAPAS